MTIGMFLSETDIQDDLVVLDSNGRAECLALTIEEDGDTYVSVETYTPAGGVPMDVWHRRALRAQILGAEEGPVAVSLKTLKEIVEAKAMVALAEKVVAGHSTEWDGNIRKGRLTTQAEEAWTALTERLRRAAEAAAESDVWHAADWIEEADGIVTATTSDDEIEEQIAPQLVKEAANDGVVIVGGAEDMADALRIMRDVLD